MELRYWLIVIGVIVIVGILFDGWRRMRGGSGKLKFKLDHSFTNLPDDDSDPDLLGPPRVVDRKREPEFKEEDMPTMSASELNRRRNIEVPQPEPNRKRHIEPQQGDLNLDADEPVPTLLTPVEDEEEPSSLKSHKEQAPVEEVLVINVIARGDEGFKGPALLQNILESGLRFGEMDIFHRHESMAGNGEVLFSMANGVKPGTFDLDDFDLFYTPAVSFFLGLPGPRHPKQAFDLMIAAARKLAHELNGELKDDQRSVMTAQTIEHYRQRIVEFERKKQLAGKR
ncbi:cell division protein ZipA [Pseudomonas sp. zbq_18]|uniref:cell division protein ZipA n=1 Tax=Pseudomonas sp. zbq_18 TaxID=3367251 RepID=UPI00370BB257